MIFMKKIILEIGGIHCKSCKIVIEDSLNELGVKDLIFDDNKLTVGFDEDKITVKQIKDCIEKEGYKVK